VAREPSRRKAKGKRPPANEPRRRSAWSYAYHHRAAPLHPASELELARVRTDRAQHDVDLAWDGHRVVACRVDAEVRLFADDLREWTDPFAALTIALGRLAARDFVLDGFVCALDDEGRPSFELLKAWVARHRPTPAGQHVAGARRPRPAAPSWDNEDEGPLEEDEPSPAELPPAPEPPVVYVAWDLLRLDDVDLRGLPLPERRARLAKLLAGADGSLVAATPLDGELEAVKASLAARRLPGLVARPHAPGRWLTVAAGAAPLEPSRPLSPRPLVTNRDKVLFPRDSLTKQQIVEYYADVAPVMLPHLRGRPVVSQRWPDGIDDFTWFQHRVPPRAPDYLRAVNIEGNRRILIENEDALLWMANQAALTFHTWASRAESLEQPDWVVIDLDPGEATGWAGLIEVAVAVRKLLELLEAPSVVKTSGQKGLHVLLPLAPGQTTAGAHAVARGIAELIHRLMPDAVCLEADSAKRRGRLLIDHLQNYVGKALVAPYSLRAVDGACVSTPLEWSEVTPALDPKAFTLRTLRRRLDARGDLFAPALRGQLQLQPLLARLR